jgi:hypothetical protein
MATAKLALLIPIISSPAQRQVQAGAPKCKSLLSVVQFKRTHLFLEAFLRPSVY